MNRCRNGILFVGHHASRTGAPIELFYFLQWFKRNGERPFSILLPSDGDLVSAYRELGDTWLLDSSRWCPGGVRARYAGALGLGRLARRAEARDARNFAEGCSPALVYANSISTAPIVEILSGETPVLTHVHELRRAFRENASPALSSLMNRTRRFIACSNAVRRHIVEMEGVAEGRVEIVHESIPMRQARTKNTRIEIFQQLGVPTNALLVAGSGTPDWRKGADLFIQLALRICRRNPRAYFVWVGGGWPPDPDRFEHDLVQSGLTNTVRITGTVANPTDFFDAADVFVSTSREDPYPLVCLEAAAVGKPIVCFADAGGTPEFVEDDCGFVVPYLDLESMADRVIWLLASEACRRKMGNIAQQKVRARHDIEIAGPKIADIIERTIASR